MGRAKSVLESNVAAALGTIRLLPDLSAELQKSADLIVGALAGGRKLLACGNGGSAADASHFATELVVRFQRERRAYPAISLCDFGTTLTAAGNDFGFDQVFARQVFAFGQKGDVLVAFTTSGNSRNVLLALQAAKEVGMGSIAFLGRGGGYCRGLATVDLLVPADVTARVQEGHLILYHSLCEIVEETLASDSPD